MKILTCKLLFLLAICLSQFAQADARSMDFRDCNADQRRDIRMANRFLREYENVLIKDFEFDARLPRADERVRRKIDRLIDDMRITCGRRAVCDSVAGRSFALSGRMVLCMRNIRNFCALVGTMAHEFAHWIGITADVGHNGGNFDSVFKFENFARDLCRLYSRPNGRTLRLPVPENIEVQAVACNTILPIRGVQFYSRTGYRGCPRTLIRPRDTDLSGDPDLRGVGRNDSISSIRINDALDWEGCKRRDYNGWCIRISADSADLGGTGFNNKINSIRPLPIVTSGLIVFQNRNFQGGQRVFNAATNNLNGSGINNEISSIRLIGTRPWQVCRDRDYGRCEEITGNVDDLRSLGTNMNNRITSLRPM